MVKSGRRAHYQVTFAVLVLGIAAFALLQSLVIPVLTTVQHELHTTQGTVTWVLTAYLLSASIMTPILGRVGDMKGKERVFVASLVALAVGSLLAALAPSIEVMIVARVIQGAGGGMVPVAFGIIRDEFPSENTGPGGVSAVSKRTVTRPSPAPQTQPGPCSSCSTSRPGAQPGVAVRRRGPRSTAPAPPRAGAAPLARRTAPRPPPRSGRRRPPRRRTGPPAAGR